MSWTQAEAIELCRKIEAVAPAAGCHVALTGGTLYKDGPRKDADILFYRIRQVKEIDMDKLQNELAQIGVLLREPSDALCGFVSKATYNGKGVDLFFPEDDGEYGNKIEAVKLTDSDKMDCGCTGGGHEPDCFDNPIFAVDAFR